MYNYEVERAEREVCRYANLSIKKRSNMLIILF